MKNYERELPPGYKEVFNIDATSKKTGLIFNGIALVIAIITVLVGCIPLFLQESVYFKIGSLEFLLLDVIFLVSMIVYMVLHELTHDQLRPKVSFSPVSSLYAAPCVSSWSTIYTIIETKKITSRSKNSREPILK